MSLLGDFSASTHGGTAPSPAASSPPTATPSPAASGGGSNMLSSFMSSTHGGGGTAVPSQPAQSTIKTATLPDFVGGGAYNVDTAHPDQVVNTGHTSYGGEKGQAGAERDDIVPVSLGGQNSNPSNIKLQMGYKTGGDADKSDTLEKQVAADYKSGKLTLAQARLKIMTQKQQQSGLSPTNTTTKSNFWGALFDIHTYGLGNIKSTVTGQTEAERKESDRVANLSTEDLAKELAAQNAAAPDKATIRAETPEEKPFFEPGALMPEGMGGQGERYDRSTGQLNLPHFNVKPSTPPVISGLMSGANVIMQAPVNASNKFGDFAETTWGGPDVPWSKKVGGVADLASGITNLIPSWTLFNAGLSSAADSKIPAVSQLAQFTQGIFNKIGKGSSAIGKFGVEHAPISNEAKANLMAPMSDLFANLGPLAVFHGIGELHEGVVGGVDEKGNAKPGAIDKMNISDSAKAKAKGAINVGMGVTMNPVGTMFNFGKALVTTIHDKVNDRIANGVQVTPDEAKKISSEAVKETPAPDMPAQIKVTTADGKELNVDTQQGLVLKNLIKGQEDLSYQKVRDLGKDSNGNPISARFEWNYKEQAGKILYSGKSTVGDLVHEFGHYVDRNVSHEIGTKLSDLLPDYEANKTEINAALAGWAANKLATEGKPNIRAKDINSEIMNLSDKFVKQVNLLTGDLNKIKATPGEENSITSAKHAQMQDTWQRLQDRKNQMYDQGKTDSTPAVKNIIRAQKALEDQMHENSVGQGGNTNAMAKEHRADFGEKFATAVRNVLLNPKESMRVAPEFTSFIQHQTQFMGWMDSRITAVVRNPDMLKNTAGSTEQKTIATTSTETKTQPRSSEVQPKATKGAQYTPKGQSITTDAFNENKINAPEDVINTMKEITSSYSQFSDVRRSMTLDEQKTFARQYLGDENLYKNLPAEMRQNAGQMLAAQQMMTDLATSLTQKLKVTDKNDTAAVADANKNFMQLVATMKSFAGARTEAGRILGSLRTSTEAGENAIAMQDLHNQLVEAGLDKEASTLEQMQKVKTVMQPTVIDRFWQYWYANNIQLSPGTYEKHIGGNIVNSMLELTSTIVRNPKEAPAAFSGLVNGWIEGYKQAFGDKQTSNVTPEQGPQPLYSGKFKFLNAIGLPSKLLNGVNTIFGEGYRNMELRGLAYDQAKTEQKTNPKLDINARALEIYNEHNPDNEKIADDFARKGTFTAKPTGVIGWFSNGMSNLINLNSDERQAVLNAWDNLTGKEGPKAKSGALATAGMKTLMKFIVPVIRTPANVLMAGINYSPLGFIDPDLITATARKFTTDEKYTRQQQQQVSRALVGTAIIGALGTYAAGGNISGAGPNDFKKKVQLQAAGWRPNSIRIGSKWYSYQSFGPMAPVLAAIGNYYEAGKYNGVDSSSASKRLFAAFVGTSKTIADEGFFTGIQNLLGAMSDPKNTSTYFNNLEKTEVTSLVPFQTLGKQVHALFDPTQYQTSNLHQYILARLGVTDGLKPQLNVFGEPVKGDRSTAINVSSETTDPVMKFLGDSEIWLSLPGKTTQIEDASTKQKRAMTPDEYYNYVKYSGQTLKSEIEKSLGYLNTLDAKDKQKEINYIVRNARKDALDRIMKEQK